MSPDYSGCPTSAAAEFGGATDLGGSGVPVDSDAPPACTEQREPKPGAVDRLQLS